MKRKALVWILMAALGLGACQATPEEDVIVQKGELEEKLTQEAVVETQADGTTKKLREQLGVPDTISLQLTSEDGKSKLIAENTPIVVPDTDHIGTATLVRCDFTDADTELWTKTFFGDGKVWKWEEQVMTKADWLKVIEDFQAWIQEMREDPQYGFSAEDEDWTQEELAYYAEQMEAAPETAPAPKYEPVEYHLEEYSDEDKGDYAMFKISGNAKSGQENLMIHNSHTIGTSACYSDDSKELASFSNYQSVRSDIPNRCQYTEEEAVAMVKELIDKLQPGNHLEVSDIKPLYAFSDGDTDASIQEPEYYEGYSITFSRALSGVTENHTYHMGDAQEVVCNEETGEAEVMTSAEFEPFGYENVCGMVTDDGVYGFVWENRMAEGEVLQENVALLPFEKIQSILNEQLPMQLVGGCGEGITYRVTRIQLGLMSVRTPNDNDSYTLLPVWDIYSMREAEDAEWVTEDSILTINAIDGSVINRDYRY